MTKIWRSPLVRGACVALAFVTILGVAVAPASAQSIIKRPGDHPTYGVEIEPHVLLHWSQAPWGSDGVGLGVRASIPLLENGFIPKLNNSVAISFGLDWAHWGNTCRYWTNNWDPLWAGYDCSVDAIWLPAAMQWNFWLTDVVSVFGEPGLAIGHRRYERIRPCSSPTGYCVEGTSETNLHAVFWAGGRFMFSEAIGAIVRIGSPSITAAINFLL